MADKGPLGLSITTKLLAGILAIVSLSILAALISLSTLDSARQAQQKLTEDTFPVLRLAQSLSFEVVSFLQTVEQRYTLDLNAAPLNQSRQLGDREARIREILLELREKILGRDSLVRIESTLERIFLKQQLLESIASEKLPLVLSSLYYSRQVTRDALDGISRELKRYKLSREINDSGDQVTLSSMQEAVFELGYLLAAIDAQSDLGNSSPVVQRFRLAIKRLATLNRELQDAPLNTYVADKANTLLGQVSDPEGLINTLRIQQQLNEQISQAVQYTRVRGFELERHLDSLVRFGNEQASYDISEFDARTEVSVGYLFYTLVVLGLGSMILVFVYLLPKVTRRLERLSASINALSNGDFETRCDVRGQDELGQMGRAMEKFRLSLAEKRQATDLLEAILEASDSGIMICESGGLCVRRNDRFQAIWGLPQEVLDSNDLNAMSEHMSLKVRTPETCVAAIDRLHSSPSFDTREIMKLTDRRFIECFSRPFRSSGREFVLFVYRDVTVRQNALEELRVSKEKAESGARAKGDFLAVMSHEIRTPMNGVIGMLNLLNSTDLNEEQQLRVNAARVSAESLMGLVTDIVDFSKIENETLGLESEHFDIQDLFGDVATKLAMQAETKNIELILDVRDLRPAGIFGDPKRIRQILRILISTSIQYTDQGEILIHARLLEMDNGALRLVARVSDSGAGIPRDKLDALFDEHNPVGKASSLSLAGSSLELALARRLSEYMGGKLQVNSTEGKGSEFNFEVVIRRSSVPSVAPVFPELEYGNILIVDDNTSQLSVLEDQLIDWGLKVFKASTAEKALSLCVDRLALGYKTVFDVALLDQNMPGVSGMDLGRKLTKENQFPGIKKVLMTPVGEDQDNDELAREGFFASLPKPVAVKNLSAILTRAFAKREAVIHKLGQGSAAEADESVDANSAPQRKLRILLVDDNETNQLVALGLLEQLGLSADVANCGLTALESLKKAPDEAPYSLVIMDCQMPKMDGYMATKAIRKGEAGDRYREVAIVAMTANALSGDREKCLSVGMDDYIAKPVVLDDFKGALSRLKADKKIENYERVG